jgi:hypothetical protein
MAAPKRRGPPPRDAGSDPQMIEHLGRRLDLEVTGTGAQRQATGRIHRKPCVKRIAALVVGGAR